jgi:hypothetical protein
VAPSVHALGLPMLGVSPEAHMLFGDGVHDVPHCRSTRASSSANQSEMASSIPRLSGCPQRSNSARRICSALARLICWSVVIIAFSSIGLPLKPMKTRQL